MSQKAQGLWGGGQSQVKAYQELRASVWAPRLGSGAERPPWGWMWGQAGPLMASTTVLPLLLSLALSTSSGPMYLWAPAPRCALAHHGYGHDHAVEFPIFS
jgi:hypothetical protein